MRRAIALGLAAMMVLWLPAASLAGGAAAGGISGTARDLSSGRLASAGIRVRDADRGYVVLETRTGAVGEFSASNLQPGMYIIEALASSGQVVGVSPIVSVIAGQTAIAGVTAAAAQAPPPGTRRGGFSLFGLGTAASVGIIAAATAAAVTTVAIVSDDRPVPSPSQ